MWGQGPAQRKQIKKKKKKKILCLCGFFGRLYVIYTVRNGWSVNLWAIENCIFSICSIEHDMRPILRAVWRYIF
jgi:hypothetical protein